MLLPAAFAAQNTYAYTVYCYSIDGDDQVVRNTNCVGVARTLTFYDKTGICFSYARCCSDEEETKE